MIDNLPFPLLVILILLGAGFFAWLISKIPATAEPYKSVALGFLGFATLVWLIIMTYHFFAGGPVVGPLPRR
jgi:hypothetical protein